jgi:hypothetical protein
MSVVGRRKNLNPGDPYGLREGIRKKPHVIYAAFIV